MDGYKFVTDLRIVDTVVVGICTHQDRVIVATQSSVFWLDGEVLKPIQFMFKEQGAGVL